MEQKTTACIPDTEVWEGRLTGTLNMSISINITEEENKEKNQNKNNWKWIWSDFYS